MSFKSLLRADSTPEPAPRSAVYELDLAGAIGRMPASAVNLHRLRHEGREIDVKPTGCVIGRAGDCDVRLGSGLVSRSHAKLGYAEDRLMVEDLGSRNGVLVNGQKIRARTVVRHGDVIGIGVVTFTVVDPRVAEHPDHMSTLPPGPGPVPWGEADVDGPEGMTAVARLDILTEREREVLELVVLGHTQREMSAMLHISVKTVETHRAHVADKLGCRTRAELVTYAISAGMLRSGHLANRS